MERNEIDANAMGGTELLGIGLERHVPCELLSRFQIIRSRVRGLDTSRIPILWLHHVPQDSESAQLRDLSFRNNFRMLVFVSNWQQQMYNTDLGVPYGDGVVICNAIEPFDATEIAQGYRERAEDRKVRIIYHSTPHRGLNIAYSVLKFIAEAHPEIDFHFDVYSSFRLYGWPERDEPYRELFERIKRHPRMTWHGAVSNDEVRRALLRSHFFFYPSTKKETSCLCAIEAMAAGARAVVSSLGALPETLRISGQRAYPFLEDTDLHAQVAYENLMAAIRDDTPKWLHESAVKLTNEFHGWPTVGKQWASLLERIVSRQPRATDLQGAASRASL